MVAFGEFTPLDIIAMASNLKDSLLSRANNQCELCSVKENLSVYEVPPVETASEENSIIVCEKCLVQIENPDKIEVNHWHCLN